jgi:hypothetical protein
MSPENVVIACYELAKFYQIDPRTFLDQTISEIGRHRYWTAQLSERMRAAQEAEAPSES